MRRIRTISIVILAIVAVVSGTANAEKNTLRRFALIAGANDGGPRRTRLQYAVSDATSLMKVLSEMGGLSREDCLLLFEPNRNEFLSGLNLIQEKIKNAISQTEANSQRCEVILYYSGHSDEEAILLGKEKIFYKEIREQINRIPADVRIAILDSCSSGAFARLKGGRMRSPFMVDSSYNMKGYAFMTSSSVDEASQESERIRGSFFTHYLTSGLRGAADMNQDGRITLSEAYQFAYSETLAVTEKTLSGPQHPYNNIQMSGTGDVIMTDIRKSSAIMIISEDISGSLFIRDRNNNLVCELRKPFGRTIQFGLENGSYSIINIKEGILYQADAVLSRGETLNISQNDFKKSEKEHTTARGQTAANGGDEPVKQELEKKTDSEYRVVPWNFSPFPMVWLNRKVIHYFSFNFFGSYSAKLDGVSLGLGPGIIADDGRGLQLNVLGNYAGGEYEGVQWTYIGNITRKKSKGLQYAGLFNYAEGTAEGAQVSHIFNISRDNARGAQVTGIFNYSSGSAAGAQVSGVFNIAKKSAKGGQVSGVFNYSGEKFTGGQIGGVFNFAGGKVTGAQVSGVANISDDLKGNQIGGVFNYAGGNVTGVQISSVANISDDLKGTQISLINIADNSKGLQVGLINIAKKQEGIPIGLVNVSGNGSIDIAVWGSNLMAANAGIVFRANYVYTILSAGWMNLDRKIDKSFAYGFHFGTRIPVNSYYLCLDAGIITIDNEKIFSYSGKEYTDNRALEARLIAGYNITEKLSLFAGGGVDYIYEFSTNKTYFREGKYSPHYLAGIKYSVFGGNL